MLVAEGEALFPLAALGKPGSGALRDELQRLELLDEVREHIAGIADDRDQGLHVLADLGRVDVDVDDLRLRREGGQLAGDAVVEA